MIPLKDAPVGRPLKVVEFDCGREARCRLIGLGIIPGSRMVITNKLSEEGPFSVIVNGTKVIVGRGILNRIFVEEDKEISLRIGIIGFAGAGKRRLINRICEKIEEFRHEEYFAPILRGQRLWRGKRVLFDVLPSVMGDFPLSIYDEVGMQMALGGGYDFVVLLAHEATLDRDLLLLQYLVDFGKSVVVAVERSDNHLYNLRKLSDLLNIPVVPVAIDRGYGFDSLFDAFSRWEVEKPSLQIALDPCLSDCVAQIVAWISEGHCSVVYPLQAVALKILETERDVDFFFKRNDSRKKLKDMIQKCDSACHEHLGCSVSEHILDRRRGVIHGALEESYAPGAGIVRVGRGILDIVMGLGLMYGFFYLLLLISRVPLIMLSRVIGLGMDNSIISVIIAIVAMLSFIPAVFLFYLFYSLLYETNFIYHLAFSADRILHGFGFHGMSLVALLANMGCSIPAIRVVNGLVEGKDRIALLLGLPFSNCIASLVVFALVLSFVFAPGTAALFMLIIMLTSMAYGLFVSWLIKQLIGQAHLSPPKVMHLPDLRVVSCGVIFRSGVRYTAYYLRKVFGIVFLLSIGLWLMVRYVPVNKYVSGISFLWEPIGLGWQEGLALLLGLLAKEMVIVTELILRKGEVFSTSPEMIRLMIFLFFYPACLPVYWSLRKTVGVKLALGVFLIGVIWSWVMLYLLHAYLGWI